MDLLLIALQEMDRELKEKRREWEKQGGREDQIDRSNYLDGFWHAWQIANRVHNEGAKNTEQQVQADSRKKEQSMANWGIASTAPEIEKIKVPFVTNCD